MRECREKQNASILNTVFAEFRIITVFTIFTAKR